MAKIYRKLLTEELCSELIATVPLMSETFESFAGQTLKRHQVNHDWSYNFYRLSKEESKKYLDAMRLPNNFIVKSFRVMHYPAGTQIGIHTDGWMESDGESNIGITVQLSDPLTYTGGEAIYNNRLLDLNIGDGVQYEYHQPHGVKKIKSGDRWILNLRIYDDQKT